MVTLPKPAGPYILTQGLSPGTRERQGFQCSTANNSSRWGCVLLVPCK